MLRGLIDTVGVGLLQAVLIGNTRGAGRRVHRDDAAAPNVLNPGRRNLQMMNAPVHAVDGQAYAFAKLVTAKPLGDDAPDDAFGRCGTMNGVTRIGALFRDPLAVQRLVHRLDDVAARAQLAQHRLGAWRYRPDARRMFGGQPHALQLAGTVDQQRPILAHGLGHVFVGAKVGKLVARVLLCDQHPVEPGEAFCVHFALKLAADLLPFGGPAPA